MKHLFFCFFVLTVGLTLWGCQRTQTPVAAQRDIGTVELVVDFGSERELIKVAIPCSAGSTVFDVLQRADMQGDLDLNAAGSGETAFVKGIDGVSGNQETGRYWFFYVDDQLAKRGCGTVEVDPGNQVLWQYQTQPADFAQ